MREGLVQDRQLGGLEALPEEGRVAPVLDEHHRDAEQQDAHAQEEHEAHAADLRAGRYAYFGTDDHVVKVDLTGSVTGGKNCTTGVPKRLVRRISDHPRRYYFNVHTPTNPSGAVRGQLVRQQ